MVDSLLAREGADLKAKLQNSIGRRKIVLSTAYSCMGCPEQSLCMLKHALMERAGTTLDIRAYAAMDSNPLCRRVLASLEPPLEHIFGDIYSLVRVKLREQLVQLQELKRAAFKEAVGKKPKQRKVLREKYGFKFMQEACGILRQHKFDLGAKAFCSVRGQGCPLVPPRADDDGGRGTISIEVRGQGSRQHG